MSKEDKEQTKLDADSQENLQQSSPQDSRKKSNQKKPSTHGMLYFLLLLIVAASGATGYFFWQQQLQLSSSMNKQLQTVSSLKQQLTANLEKINTNSANNTNNAETLQQLTTQIQQTEIISQRAIEIVNRGQRDWALAEIGYLLRIAHQRLAVARDIGGAIAALKGADSRLIQLGDLSLFKVREQLAKDIASLNAIYQADVNGISLALDQVIAYLPDLPFKSIKDEIKIQLTETNSDKQQNKPTFVDTVIETVRQIGDIKVHQRSIKAASSAQQQNSIEQLLRTYLLGARLAALRFNQTQFLHEINQASEILHSYYDEKDNRIQQLKKNLLDYSVLQLSPDLPELTKAWKLLQKEINNPSGLKNINQQQENKK